MTDEELRNHFNFGAKIRRFRQEKGLRLSDLAQETGLSISLLSQLENNKVSPSVVTLYRLSNVFERPMGVFFDDVDSRDSFAVRRDERKIMFLEDDHAQFELLSPDLQNKKMEALVIRLGPGHVSREKTHPGEEVGLVLKGRVSVTLSGQGYILEEGDSIYYPSSVPHQ
ncbi:MAG: cupin domain-containing protein, partial [Deltaproteobacteria bacterium]|nr:cupin domain-containing protein [Deltaproteobacteria bacterium]